MKRAAKLPPLPIELNPRGSPPLWYQVAVGLRVAIARGRLGPGARVPSTRTLARQLGVSRTTVMTAYDDLAARGLLQGRTGNGSYVVPAAPRRRSAAWFEDPSGTRLRLTPLP